MEQSFGQKLQLKEIENRDNFTTTFGGLRVLTGNLIYCNMGKI